MGCAILRNPMALLILQALFSLAICFSFNPNKLLSQALDDGPWTAGHATHYSGLNEGASEGNSCGLGADVNKLPYNKMVTAATDDLYQNGKGCGSCYKIKCLKTANKLCSEIPIHVTLVDQCGGACGGDSTNHFDLAGFAMQQLADSGHGEALFNAGVVAVLYQKVSCNYGSTKIGFKVDAGSNEHYLSVETEFMDGNGQIKLLQLVDSTKNIIPMSRLWGNMFTTGSVTAKLSGPFSLEVTDYNGKTITTPNVIPANYRKSQTYMATVNFDT